MCNFMSALVLRDGTIICEPEYTDSHEDLVEANRLRDDGRGFVRIEFTPPEVVSKIADADAWTLRLDEGSAPDWWEEIRERIHEDMKARVRRMIVTESRKCILGGTWILTGNASIGKIIRGRVLAYDSSQVKAYDSSQVTAYGSSQVKACGSSQVTAYDSSQVTAYGSSQVTAYGSSQVKAYGSSQVKACGSSQVTACQCGSCHPTIAKK